MSISRIAVIFLFCLLSITSLESAITIKNLGTGVGRIELFSSAPPSGVLLETCDVGANNATCNIATSQDTVNGNVIRASALAGTFFEGWGGSTGNVGSCDNALRTCTITGSTSNGTHAANVTFTACTVNISPTLRQIGWAGGAGNIEVTVNVQDCGWSAASLSSWITLSGATNGTGNGTVSYTVLPNRTTDARNGIIEISGKEFTVMQEAYQPIILITPDPIEFGTLRTGTLSERIVTVRNVSERHTLQVSSVNISGANATDFRVANTCTSISPNGSCSMRVAFAPQSSGEKFAKLIVNSDDTHLPTYEVALSGTASDTAVANISTSPQSFSFSNIEIEFGHSGSVQITNTGTATLLIDDIRITGRNGSEFYATNTCPMVLPGNTCRVMFTAYYTSNSPKEAFLIIRSNAQNKPVVEIPITANDPACMGGTVTLSETSKTVNFSGGDFTNPITKTGERSCIRIASYSAPWLTAELSDTALRYTVRENSSSLLRMHNIKVGGEIFTVIQHKDANNTTFDDIAGNYFADYINAIYSLGITVGCVQDRSYCPLDPVTRGQMAAFIIRALQGESIIYTTTPYFTDVPSSHWAFKYVQKMRDLGITVVTGTYRVNDYVSRGEMAAFIIRAIFGEDFTYTQTPYFSDVSQNHVFFKYVQKMKDTGITAVTGIYRVDDYVTRQEMAAFLGRAFLGMR
jgi:hypothetical protein